MKKRIIALVLVVVMSVLALSSCGNYDFSKSHDAYASFDFDGFMAALNSIEIKDGDFTTNAATRENLVKSKIYTAIADKIIAATAEDDRKETGKLGAGDVLYFTYYAVDEKTGNIFYTSEMKESSLTSTKTEHVIKLGDTNEDSDFLKLVKENLEKDVEIDEFVYSMLLKADIEAAAEKALKETKPEATADEIKAAKAEAIKVKAGDTIVISYTRSYTKTAEGEESAKPVDETAVYETITLSADHPLYNEIINAKVNNVGETVEFAAPTEEKPEATSKEKEIEIDGVKYTYKNIKIEWKVEKAGKYIATFKYTPYTKDQNETPDNLRVGSTKVNLKDVELTYYVFPVYAITAPVYEEITAVDILVHAYSSKVTATTFEIFEDESYVTAEGKKITELVQEIVDIFDTKSSKYADGELKTLLEAYNKANSGSNTTEKTATKTALEKGQKAAAKPVIEKLVTATNGTKTAAEVITEEYYESNFHSMKEAYDTDIQQKVQKEVWALIDKYVTVDENALPAELVKEFSDALYEAYEYEYYTGKYNNSTTVTNYDQFSENGGLEAFLKYKLGNKANMDEVNAEITKLAKAEIIPIVKIFVVSEALAEQAKAAMPGYIESDKAVGQYDVDKQSYIDYYGEEKYEKHYNDAVKNAEKQFEYDLKQAGLFIVDNAYLRNYKKNVGAAAYRQELKDYGKTNLRVAFQFDNLFYYLTSTNLVMSEDGDHAEVKYVTRDGADYIDFRNVKYTIKAEVTE